MIKIIAFLFCSVLSFFALAQSDTNKQDCSIMKNGSFKYLDAEDSTAYFEIENENHIEYHQGGKYYIKSRLKWINDCQYEMKMLENTIPDFPFKPGEKMIVTIINIEGDIIYYTSEVRNMKWKGRLIKQK